MNKSSKKYVLNCLDNMETALQSIDLNCEEKDGSGAYRLYDDITRILNEIDIIRDIVGNSGTVSTIHELRNELLKHDDLYKGFVASVKSAIDECTINVDSEKVSEYVLNRIVGEE